MLIKKFNITYLAIKNLIPKVWYTNNLLIWILVPLELIYCLIILIRRYGYQSGWFNTLRLPVPVIVVGNINVGGSGKTPLVLWISQFLVNNGWRPGIISRGYGGTVQSIPQIVKITDDPKEVGDEPIILARHSGVPVAVGNNRVLAGDLLIANYSCNCLIADDGLQHYRLIRDLEIVAIDREMGFGNSHCLPIGPLREPLTRLKNIPLHVIKGINRDDEYQMQLTTNYAILINNNLISRPLENFKKTLIHAVAGIGYPKRFFDNLQQKGLNIISHHFPDHHYYHQEELEFGDNLPILMTEKDAIKCTTFATNKHWYVPIKIGIDSKLGNKILELIGKIDNPKMNKPLRFIVIRRDNIGDLVCTTPLFLELHNHFPNAEIYALVTGYNHTVLANHPAINQIFWYDKTKHLHKLYDKIRTSWQILKTIIKLRQYNFDYALIPISNYEPRSVRLARLIGAKRIVGFGDKKQYRQHDLAISLPPLINHEVARAFYLLSAFGVNKSPDAVRIYPNDAEITYAQNKIKSQNWQAGLIIGIHISARKLSQRWPAINFIKLISNLNQNYNMQFILFRAPGDKNNLTHPGDNDKAQEIMQGIANLPVLAFPSRELSKLIAGIANCQLFICSDGGAMHLAAGLGKPIVCMFGKSDASRWHPWGVPYKLLQSPNQDVTEISVTEVQQAIEQIIIEAIKIN